jgi:hypothetical protein
MKYGYFWEDREERREDIISRDGKLKNESNSAKVSENKLSELDNEVQKSKESGNVVREKTNEKTKTSKKTKSSTSIPSSESFSPSENSTAFLPPDSEVIKKFYDMLSFPQSPSSFSYSSPLIATFFALEVLSIPSVPAFPLLLQASTEFVAASVLMCVCYFN